MSFFKKIGETARNTASTIGAKSAVLVEMGKLKMAKSQHESQINQKKTEIGHLIYSAHKEGAEPDQAQLEAKINEIAEMETQIQEIDHQLERLKEAEDTKPTSSTESAPAATADMPTDSPAPESQEAEKAAPDLSEEQSGIAPAEEKKSSKFCTECGSALDSGVKFCPNCGKAV